MIGVGFALLPSPYVIEQPGPVYDTLGVAEHEGEEVPLIEIPDEQTFPTDGELNLLTGQPSFTTARVREPGEVLAVPLDELRDLVNHDTALGDLLIGAECAREAQQRIDERRLAVIDVRDDRDVAEVFAGFGHGPT